MNITVQAGKIGAVSLAKWLAVDCIKWAGSVENVHALIEYVHRFAFIDSTGMAEDIGSGEIETYCLKGRIFWEHGQVEWRRLDRNTFSLLVITENGSLSLPDELQPAPPFECGEITSSDDKNLILWGTLNTESTTREYLELQVSGSRPIEYPAAITAQNKQYPVLVVREYFDENGETLLWRFVRPAAMDEVELASPDKNGKRRINGHASIYLSL